MALRLCVSALARETLLANGSEAFVRAEAQAMRWASEASHSGGPFSDVVRDRASSVVQDIFRMADG